MPARRILPLLLLTVAAPPASAIHAIVLQAAEIEAPDWRVQKVDARLTLSRGARGQLTAERISRVADDQRVEALSIACSTVVVSEPHFACRNGQMQARLSGLGLLKLRGNAVFRSDKGAFVFDGGRFELAGSTVTVSARGDARSWSLSGAGDWTLPALRRFAAPWLTLPESFSLDGSVSGHFAARGRFADRARTAAARLTTELRVDGLDLSNEDGTIATEKVEASASITAELGAGAMPIEIHLSGPAGQALAGPVLLDLRANPLSLTARGHWHGPRLEIDDLRVASPGLMQAHGNVTADLGNAPGIAQAHIVIDSLEFPAAYTSFLQLALAATDFGTMRSSGQATGAFTIANGAFTRVDARVVDLGLDDTRGRFHLRNLDSELHWQAAVVDPVAPSWLQWNSWGAYGLSGGATRLDFETRGAGFALTKPARLPIFDGALAMHTLAVRRLGRSDAELDFESTIEPISMPQLSRAFGWPELAGQLAGRIPAMSYRNKVLTVGGDLVAQVFGGQIVGSNFRLQDPLGPWPRLAANVRAHNLDLELVTRAFPIGTITGRLEGHLLGLELFAWSPVAFDALLRTPEGDRSPHRISARAVGNLSNIGGGGGRVMQALQSGMLQFFDEYRYDELGIRCRLHDDVCLMGGIEPARDGYYIVKGRGLPRIDIIGNVGRVNWRQLVSQVVAAMRAEGVSVH
ncbi:MAG: hypothetical protein IPI06_11015 [Gammaproteobacteria bacterium]|nr:hypothetical protein [Gammaproteobacteria bacterium]